MLDVKLAADTVKALGKIDPQQVHAFREWFLGMTAHAVRAIRLLLYLNIASLFINCCTIAFVASYFLAIRQERAWAFNICIALPVAATGWLVLYLWLTIKLIGLPSLVTSICNDFSGSLERFQAVPVDQLQTDLPDASLWKRIWHRTRVWRQYARFVWDLLRIVESHSESKHASYMTQASLLVGPIFWPGLIVGHTLTGVLAALLPAYCLIDYLWR